MAENLISRLKEKPIRYGAQGLLTLIFINETLETGIRFAERINNYEPQIREFAGGIVYWTAQIGLPIAEAGLTAALGYVATKGAGMFLDKYWYEPKLESSE